MSTDVLEGVTRPGWREPDLGLVEMLAERRRVEPERAGLHTLSLIGRGLHETPVSFEDIFVDAEKAAALLHDRGVRAGDRVLLSLGDPREFLGWFLGVLGSGAIAVPLPGIGGLNTPTSHRERVAAVAADCAPRLAVVEHADRWRAAVDSHVTPALDGSEIASAECRQTLAPASLGAPAFLQYTSGSTASPKGVVVSHRNLAANLQAVGCGMGIAHDERMISWLPLHHDMGLIGALLWPLYCGGEAYLMRPLVFLSRPSVWLQAIARFRGTVTVGPSFGYRLCIRSVRDEDLRGLDLSSLRLALCGAEPIEHGLVDTFRRRFGPHGFRPRAFFPVYGLAEATLAVTFPEPGSDVLLDVVDRKRPGRGRAERPDAPARLQTLVSVGAALPGHAIEIVSADGRRCEEREVGEVVVRGPSVTTRYWSDPVQTSRNEVHTGDLGYVASGQLFLIDRLKDLVIVAGQNYASWEIEACAQIAGVRAGGVAAFGVPDRTEGTERIVLVCEFDRKSGLSPVQVAGRARANVRDRLGLGAEIVLVEPGAVEKTTSGKVRRTACRNRYETGALQVVTTTDTGDTADVA